MSNSFTIWEESSVRHNHTVVCFRYSFVDNVIKIECPLEEVIQVYFEIVLEFANVVLTTTKRRACQGLSTSITD